MVLIAIALMLIAAAILFPDGTRTLILFMVKVTGFAVLAACVLAVLLLSVGRLHVRDAEPVKKVSGPTHHEPASVIVLDDGTKLDLIGGWYNNVDGSLVLSDEDDALRVKLYREYQASLAAAKQ